MFRTQDVHGYRDWQPKDCHGADGEAAGSDGEAADGST